MRHPRPLSGWSHAPLAGGVLLALLAVFAGCAGQPVASAGSPAVPPPDAGPRAGAVTASPAQIFQDVPQSP